jgi:hypothetical protein
MIRGRGILSFVSVLLGAAVLAGCYAPQTQKSDEQPIGVVTGKISDEDSEEALAAEITFPFEESLQGIISDPESGIYKLELPPGIHRMRILKEGYAQVEVPVQVVEGRTILKDVALKRKRAAKGTLTGKIADASTGEPLGAMVRFSGTNLPPTASDLSTGIYRTELPPGTYVVTIEAQGYLSVSSPVVVEKDSAVIQNFELRKK